MSWLWFQPKTKKLYGWKASKLCVRVFPETNEADRKLLIDAGLWKPAKVKK